MFACLISRSVKAVAAGVTMVCLGAVLVGCVSGPSRAANAFVKAVRQGDYAEASSYLSPAIAPQTQDSNAFRGLVPNGRGRFVTTQESETTARVQWGSTDDTYAMLTKSNDGWQIDKLHITIEGEDEEAVPYGTKYQDDATEWEGISEVLKPGVKGRARCIRTQVIENGKLVDDRSRQVEVLTAPVSEVVRRGTKSRSAGAIPFGDGSSTLRVTRVERETYGLNVDCEFGYPEPSSRNVAVSFGHPARTAGARPKVMALLMQQKGASGTIQSWAMVGQVFEVDQVVVILETRGGSDRPTTVVKKLSDFWVGPTY